MVKEGIKKAALPKKARSHDRKQTDMRTTAPRLQKWGKFGVSSVSRVLDRLAPKNRLKSQISGFAV